MRALTLGRDAADAPVAPSRDGRVRRSERSREAIVGALFALVGEGVLEPTAQQVAARAGVGLRSVFRHFDDMESLYAAMDGRLRAEAIRLVRAAPAEGAPRVRALDLVRRRALLFERIGPYKRAGNAQRLRSRFLEARHADLVRELRADLHRSLPGLARSPARRDALELVTSFEAWDRLRTDQRLSRPRAQQAVEAAVLALLDGARETNGRRRR